MTSLRESSLKKETPTDPRPFLDTTRSAPPETVGSKLLENITSMEYVMATKPQWRTLLSLGCLSFALMGNVARAESIPIVTGEQWVASSPEAKKAYLVGVANMLEIERAYAGNAAAHSNDIAPRFAKGMQGQSLDSVRQGLDNWYAANPTRIQHPVIETLWFEMVVPGLKKNQ
ncbi:hypothetical protein [Paraburkholderia sp. RAU2J]|uniref:hypothetical protein n=1 Tax=Paraburkholderia sp. RAU2J TaxID=1938810 RepID=UPI0032201889